jgi:hypothetical protein
MAKLSDPFRSVIMIIIWWLIRPFSIFFRISYMLLLKGTGRWKPRGLAIERMLKSTEQYALTNKKTEDFKSKVTLAFSTVSTYNDSMRWSTRIVGGTSVPGTLNMIFCHRFDYLLGWHVFRFVEMRWSRQCNNCIVKILQKIRLHRNHSASFRNYTHNRWILIQFILKSKMESSLLKNRHGEITPLFAR